jgi:glycosyltransferase involved in cell wall biosynthesis
MRIAIFTNNYLPNPYGVSTSVEGFRLALTNDGHKVYIFAPKWGEECVDDSCDIFRYPSFKAPTKIDFSLVVPHSSKIDNIISDLSIDVIHAQHPNLLGTTAQKWAKKKDVPLVFTWHSLYDKYAHYATFIPEKLSAKWVVNNAVEFANGCDGVVVPTGSVESIIKKAGVEHNNISVVPSGVDEKLFANPDGENIRQKYNIAKDKIVLGTVSRLTQEKNVLFLASVVSDILVKYKDIVFVVAGEGDLQEDMKEIFENKGVINQVIFVGKIEREDVKNYLDAFDVFVYASTSETQGTIVTENMYVGKPIVAVAENGVGDLVESGVNGLSTKEDKKEFAQALQKIIDDSELRKELGQNAKKLAKEKYTTTACAQNLLEVYEKTIEGYKNK